MSDLRDQISDQAAAPTSRITAANRPLRDRGHRFCDLLVLSSALLFTCARPPSTTAASSVQRPEIWVDAFSQPGGDGTKEKPLKALPLQLANVDVHLRAGLYAGPIALGDGTRLEGHGEVVLVGDVTAHRAALVNVTIQGGALRGGGLTLGKVTFSGQRTLALELDGPLAAREVRFHASVEGVAGIVAKDTRVELVDATFRGGFVRAIDVSGGQLALTRVTFEGAKTGVRALDGASSLSEIEATGGSATGLVFAGGSVVGKGIDIRGYEFGVQLSRGVASKWTGVTVRGSAEVCFSAVQQAKVELTTARFERCGRGGALSFLDARSTVRDVDVRDGSELGVFVRQGSASFTKLDVRGIRGGDALHVRDAIVHLEASSFSDVDGSGLYVSAAANVTGTGVQVERAAQAAVFVERGSSLTLEQLLVRGGRGAAVVVPDAARVSLGTLSVSGGNEAPVYAECDRGARVEIGRIESTIEQLPSRCVIRRAGSRRGNGE